MWSDETAVQLFSVPKGERQTKRKCYLLLNDTHATFQLFIFQLLFIPPKLIRLAKHQNEKQQANLLRFHTCTFCSLICTRVGIQIVNMIMMRSHAVWVSSWRTSLELLQILQVFLNVDVKLLFQDLQHSFLGIFTFLYTWKTLTIHAWFAVGVFINDLMIRLLPYKGGSTSLSSLYQMIT